MMGEQRAMQEALFYGFSLERHVPDGHLLRKIDRFVVPRRRPAFPSCSVRGRCQRSPGGALTHCKVQPSHGARNSGHSFRAWRKGQIDPEAQKFPGRQCPTAVDERGVGPHFIHELVKRVDPESSFRATPETFRLRISLRR
jgi:hypothetical protein